MPLLPRRGSYGVDAPYMLVVPGAIIVFNVTMAAMNRSMWGGPWVPTRLVTATKAQST